MTDAFFIEEVEARYRREEWGWAAQVARLIQEVRRNCVTGLRTLFGAIVNHSAAIAWQGGFRDFLWFGTVAP